MVILYLLLGLILVKIVLIDSPLGKALGDAVRNLAPERIPEGAASRAEVQELREEVEELRDRLERIVEEQAFLTRLLSEPRRLRLGSGEANEEDTGT